MSAEVSGVRPAAGSNAVVGLLKPFELKPIAALSCMALTLGGLIVLLLFSCIGFMPDADLASTTGILFAAALEGFWSIVVSLLVGLLPGLVMTIALRARGLPPRRRFVWVVPLLAISMAVAVLLVQLSKPAWYRAWMSGAWVWAGAAVAVGVVGAKLASSEGRQFDIPQMRGWRSWAQDMGAFGSSAIAWLWGMFTVLDLAVKVSADNGWGATSTISVMVLWILLLVWINTIAAALPLPIGCFYQLLNLAPLLLLLTVLAGGAGALATHVLRQLGLAELPRVDLVLEPGACRALMALPDAGLQCQVGGGGADAVVGAVHGVRVRSRIGSQVVVARQGASGDADSSTGGGKDRTPYVVFRKTDIVLLVRR